MLIIIMILHFLADFLLQSRAMAKGKSEKFSILIQHLTIQFAVLLSGTWFFFDNKPHAIALSLLNALIHGVIDWNIWRIYKRNKSQQWEFWNDRWFYITIGFDQLLHVITLILIYG